MEGTNHQRDPLDVASGPLKSKKPSAEDLARQEQEARDWMRQSSAAVKTSERVLGVLRPGDRVSRKNPNILED